MTEALPFWTERVLHSGARAYNGGALSFGLLPLPPVFEHGEA
jgi:hypothetical protein